MGQRVKSFWCLLVSQEQSNNVVMPQNLHCAKSNDGHCKNMFLVVLAVRFTCSTEHVYWPLTSILWRHKCLVLGQNEFNLIEALWDYHTWLRLPFTDVFIRVTTRHIRPFPVCGGTDSCTFWRGRQVVRFIIVPVGPAQKNRSVPEPVMCVISRQWNPSIFWHTLCK